MSFGRATVLVVVATVAARAVAAAEAGSSSDTWSPCSDLAPVLRWDENIGSRLQMMADDGVVGEAIGLQRVMRGPERDDKPIMFEQNEDNPIEINPYLFGTVMNDPRTGTYRMWYESGQNTQKWHLNKAGERTRRFTPVLYANSTDSVNWERPRFGKPCPVEDTDCGNMILHSHWPMGPMLNPSVLYDDVKGKYVMFVVDQASKSIYETGGVFAYLSDDGIDWAPATPDDKPVLWILKANGTVSDVADVVPTLVNGNYLIYAKGWRWTPNIKPVYRLIVRCESKGRDLTQWNPCVEVITHRNNAEDPQSYGMPVFQYEGLFIGLLRRFYDPGTFFVDQRLAISKDSLNWNIVNGTRDRVGAGVADWSTTHGTFFPVGETGRWDQGMVFMIAPVIEHDRLIFYYGGFNAPHNARKRGAGVGRSVMKHGRFASFTSKDGETTGELVTSPVVLSRPNILVNFRAGAGSVCVVIEQADGTPIKGYTRLDCDALVGDETDALATWAGVSSVGLHGRRVRLRFILTKDAEIFAFRNAAGDRTAKHATASSTLPA